MKYIIANWKMNMDLPFLTTWLNEFSKLMEKEKFENEIILASSFSHLSAVSEFCDKHEHISAAAQDVSIYERGAHTGYVGAFDLKYFCRYCVVGHSERQESEREVEIKVSQCLNNDIIPIICFAKPEQVEKYQRKNSLLVWEDPDHISKDGVYRTAETGKIKSLLEKMKSAHPDEKFLYGGSVNRDNIGLISEIPQAGGVLVGNASLDPRHFLDLVIAFSERK